MADGGEDTDNRQQAPGLGDLISILIAQLQDDGLIIGTREQVALHAVVARWLQDQTDLAPEQGPPPDVGQLLLELGPLLAPVLARSREERERFFAALQRVTSGARIGRNIDEDHSNDGDVTPDMPASRQRLKWIWLVVTLIAMVMAALLIIQPWKPRPLPLSETPAETGIKTDSASRILQTAPLREFEEAELNAEDRWLQRILSSAEQHDHAPTLEEVASDVMGDPEFEEAGLESNFVDVPLEGHTGPLTGAVFSNDEIRVVTTSEDSTARLWDVSNGAQIGPALRHESYVTGVVFSPDSTRILTWSEDSTARVWDADSAGPIAVLRHDDWVYGATFSSDSAKILTWSEDRTARLWDAATGQQIAPALSHDDAVNGATFYDDESRILTWSGREARFWNSTNSAQIGEALQHENFVNGAVFSSDETRILTWSRDNTARLWDLATGDQTGPALQHDSWVTGAVFSQDETRILTWSKDSTARLWDASTGAQIFPPLQHEGPIRGAAFFDDETRILTWSEDSTARIWNASTGNQIGASLQHTGTVYGATFFKDSTEILTWSGDGTARLWDGSFGFEIGPALQHDDPVFGAVFSKDEKSILTWGEGSSAHLWKASKAPGWSQDSFAQRLHELSGLPLGKPLDLFRPDAAGNTNWARLALALARIEAPDDVPSISELNNEVHTAYELAGPQGAGRLLPVLEARLGDNKPPADFVGMLEELHESGAAAGIPASAAHRALAILDDPSLPDAEPVWRPDPPLPAAAVAPSWLRWLAAAVPLCILAWFFTRYALRRPFLRRRQPSIPPLHTDLVSDAGRRVAFDAGLFQRAGQRLLTRTPQASAVLDIRETIAATLKEGGVFVSPVYASTRARPEYLVLIERASAGDHEAARLRQLIERLKGLVDYDVWYFQTEPGELESEDRARRLTIDQAQTRFPEHRLIILGTGEGLLDPVTFETRPVANKLRFWSRRALLTPVALAAWSREEYALAEGLAMPVGRATAEGLLTLSDLLGLEGADTAARLNPRGDGLARPLPDIFRGGGQRFLYPSAPDEQTLQRLLRELKGGLDEPGFEWLAALGVYPAIQWDLTLYLGVELPRRTGGDSLKDPLYDEARLASLSQLPWLKSGRMPNWLRRALIAELAPARREEVRSVIAKAIEAARPKDTEEEQKLQLRIGREAPKEETPPERLLEDEVLLDFLMARNEEDFPLARFTRLNQIFERSFWEQFGAPEWLTALACAAFAAAAFTLSPHSDSGPMITGALMPLALLALGGTVLLALWNPRATALRALRLSERAAPLGLVIVAILLSAFLVSGVGSMIAQREIIDGVRDPTNLRIVRTALAVFPWFTLCAAAVLALLLYRRLGEWMGVNIYARPLGQPGALRQLLVHGVGSFALLFCGAYLASDFLASVLGGLPFEWQLGLMFLPFGLMTLIGCLSSSFGLSDTLHSNRSPVSAKIAAAPQAGRAILATAVIVLATLAAFHLNHSHSRRELQLEVVSATTSADGQILGVLSASGDLLLLDADSRQIGSPIPTPEGVPVAIALGGTSSAPRAAIATDEGRVFEYTPGGRFQPLTDPETGATLTSVGSPPRLAFAADGTLFAAVEREGGAVLVASDRAVRLETEAGPPVALLAPEPGLAAVATLDGSVFIVGMREGEPATLLQRVRQPAEPASPVRQLYRTERPGEIRMLTTDGQLWKISYAPGTPPVLADEGFSWTLALGPPASKRTVRREEVRDWPNFDEASLQFSFLPPGELKPGTGKGVTSGINHAPDMEFPIANWPAYLGSHIHGFGGSMVGGDQCDARNFEYPWQDAYCEARPGGNRSSLDCATREVATSIRIRAGTPALCSQMRGLPAAQRTQIEVVAAENGTITNVGTYTVTLQAGNRQYRYLHLNMAALQVAVGDAVQKGQLIGYASNDFGGTPTTLGLGFELRINDPAAGWVSVSPYVALVEAYSRKLAAVADDKKIAYASPELSRTIGSSSEIRPSERMELRRITQEEQARARAEILAEALLSSSATRGLGALDGPEGGNKSSFSGDPDTSINWLMPVPGRITLSYGAQLSSGQKSEEILIQTESKAQVIAPTDGVVEFARPFRSYGNLMIFRADSGDRIVMSGFKVMYPSEGQSVNAGQPLGVMPEDTESSPELRLEVRVSGTNLPIDPAGLMGYDVTNSPP